MKIADVTEEYAARLLLLWDEVIGGIALTVLSPDALYQGIAGDEAYFGGYRLGSRWDMNSKLHIGADEEGNLRVSFDDNFPPQQRTTANERFVEAQAAGVEFERRSAELEHQEPDRTYEAAKRVMLELEGELIAYDPMIGSGSPLYAKDGWKAVIYFSKELPEGVVPKERDGVRIVSEVIGVLEPHTE